MKTRKHDAIVLSSSTERDSFIKFVKQLKSNPLPDDELLANLGLFLTSKASSSWDSNISAKCSMQHHFYLENLF